MPSPVSDTMISTCEPTRRTCVCTRAAARRELDGVRQQVPHRLLQPLAIAVDAGRAVLDHRLHAQPLHLRRRLDGAAPPPRPPRPRSTSSTSSRSLPEMMRDRSSRSSISRACAAALRTIASIGLGGARRIGDAGLEDLAPAHDGVDRRAQLVRERRQELVLGPVRGARLAVGARVVDGQRGPLRHRLRDQQILAVVGAAGLGGHEGHHAERSAVGDERHRDVRVELQRRAAPRGARGSRAPCASISSVMPEIIAACPVRNTCQGLPGESGSSGNRSRSVRANSILAGSMWAVPRRVRRPSASSMSTTHQSATCGTASWATAVSVAS